MGLENVDVVRLPAAATPESAPESVPYPSRKDDGRPTSDAVTSVVERIWDALRLVGVVVTAVVSRRPVRPLPGGIAA
jgi:hypothetical protein